MLTTNVAGNIIVSTSVFVGRDEEMQKLSSLFFEENRKKVVIIGQLGIGKSELVNKFTKFFIPKKQIQNVFWIDSEEDGTLIAFKNILNGKTIKGEKYLFILDNVISEESLSEVYLPEEYFYLITSQNEKWEDTSITIPLDRLTARSSLEIYKIYLGPYYKYTDRKLYEEIANLMFHIPLGLQITAATIREAIRRLGHAFNIRAYIEKLRPPRRIRLSASYQYNGWLYTAIKVSLNSITLHTETESQFALLAVYVCSYLGPGNIPFAILNILLSNEINYNVENLKNSICLLKDYSLVTLNPAIEVIKMHRSIQRLMQRHITDNNPNSTNKYYTICLELLIKYKKNMYSEFSPFSCLQYADENYTTFTTFCHTHKEILTDLSNCTVLDQVLKYLIMFKCIKSIEHIFEYFDNKSKSIVIDKLNLLHEAIKYDYLDILDYLLKFDVDINNKNEMLDSPLHVAAFKWHFSAMQRLLDHEPNLGEPNIYGNTPLFNFIEGARYCQNIIADEVNRFLLNLCIYKYKNYKNLSGETIYHAAAASCQKELILLLIDKYNMPVNKNIQDSLGRTPLHTLFYRANQNRVHEKRLTDTANLLIQKTADINLKDNNNMTPLDVAIQEQLDFIVIIFLKLDCNIEKYISTYNLLHKTIIYNNLELLEKLLSVYKVDVNIVDKNCNTGLHTAAFYWNLNAVEYLIKNKADIEVRNDMGNTPLLEFCRGAFNYNNIDFRLEKVKRILKILQCKNYENTINFCGETILHLSSASLNDVLVNILLTEYDFDVNKMDKRNRTPLYSAISVSNQPHATSKKITTMSKLLRRYDAYIAHENMTLYERAVESIYHFNLLHKLISSNLLKIFNLEFPTAIDVNIEDKNKNTLLHTAAFHNNLDAIKVLIERKANKTARNDYGNIPLFEFVRGTRNLENICMYEVNEILDLLYCENIVNNAGENMLHVAAASLNADLVNMLCVDYKMDANAMSSSGETSLHALFFKLTDNDTTKNLQRICETTMQLKLHGASLDIKNYNGESPIDIAKRHNKNSVVLISIFEDRYIEEIKKIFHDFGASTTTEFIDNHNLLHYAAACNQVKVLELLLQYNINVNSRNSKLCTALHLASFHWNLQAIRILTQYNADLNATCNQNFNALNYFFKGGIHRKQTDFDKMDEIMRLLQNNKETVDM